MINHTNTRCIKKANIVQEMQRLKENEPNHRHLTSWMLYLIVSNLRTLDDNEGAEIITNLIE